MHNTLRHFDILSRYGLKAIPLRPCSKIPVCRGWTNYNPELARSLIERNPEYNVGILLGEIIDVEGDSEHANKTIINLIGDCPHPTYKSARSTHHLFQNPDPDLTILKFQQIEFRADRHQSAVPPSVMQDGVVYRWLEETVFPIPPMPERLLRFYHELQRTRPALKPGHCKTTCFECQKQSYIHRKRLQLEITAFKGLGLRWTCHDCRKVDLRPLCRKLRKRSEVTTLVYDHS